MLTFAMDGCLLARRCQSSREMPHQVLRYQLEGVQRCRELVGGAGLGNAHHGVDTALNDTDRQRELGRKWVKKEGRGRLSESNMSEGPKVISG